MIVFAQGAYLKFEVILRRVQSAIDCMSRWAESIVMSPIGLRFVLKKEDFIFDGGWYQRWAMIEALEQRVTQHPPKSP